jgi:hypothetical protein
MRVLVGTLLLPVLALAGAGGAGAQSGGAAPRIGQVAWLAGCWEQVDGRRTVDEQWTRPRGGLMLGAGRTLDGDFLVEFEQVRIFERRGRLVYGARPSGQDPAEFESILVSDSAVTFENLGHDFPQRVMYRRVGMDSLVGRVEGRRAGRIRGVDFPYRRASCP